MTDQCFVQDVRAHPPLIPLAFELVSETNNLRVGVGHMTVTERNVYIVSKTDPHIGVLAAISYIGANITDIK